MVTVTKVKDGLWHANFPKFQLDFNGSHRSDFQLDQMNYQVEFVLGWGPNLIVKGDDSATTNEERHSPQMISAIINGQLCQMVQSENGDWGPVQPTKSFLGINNSVQFIIEFQHSNKRQHIPSHFAHLFDSQMMADVKFLVKDEEIGAHLAIVVSASPVMAAMLEPDKFKEGVTRSAQINDVEPDVFKEMLRYLYTGTVPQLQQMAESLFVAADRFQIQGLQDLCTEQLIRQVDMNNAVRYLVLGHLHLVPRLLESSLQCLEKNKNGLWNRTDWKNFAENYPEVFYQVTGRMMK